MPTIREQLITDIAIFRGAPLSDREIARKVFLLDPAYIFKEHPIVGFKILNRIAEKFHVPIGCIKIAGSSQIGFSPFKDRDFKIGESDLDVAIVNPGLFQQYCEIVYNVTNGYRDLTGFKSTPDYGYFQECIQIGYFRPDLMPNCPAKTDWFKFYGTVTDSYSTIFKQISAGIYFSETFFEGKQVSAVKLIK